MLGLVSPHELESFGGIEPVSRANQAAAFFRISRSSRSVFTSRRSRRSSSRSSLFREDLLLDATDGIEARAGLFTPIDPRS
jgi:hypothetical protein